MAISRRRFLTYLGLGTYAALVDPVSAAKQATFPLSRRKGKPPDFFEAIRPSTKDELILPDGYRYDLICRWGDSLGSKNPQGEAEFFGFNNDYTSFFPIDALAGGKNTKEGLLWVNHEYPHPLFVSKYPGNGPKTEQQIITEKLSVGGSVLHIRLEGKVWKHLPGSKFNRRLTALYPQMEMTGPASVRVPQATGTLANCSGGWTPWNTVLSCEEHFSIYNETEKDGMRWSDVASQKINEHEYGWVVEVDPFGELPPQKHTALGRFDHESAALRIGPTGRLVYYMGDDGEDQHFYKYVSAGTYNAKASRKDNRRLLTEGTLYGADFRRGRWLPIDIRRSARVGTFENQARVLVYTRDAACTLGATPLDRPEVCQIHPLDGTVYLSLTYNTAHGNLFGQIIRLIEDKDNPEGESFRYEIFLAGGPQSGLACPDNLIFDKKGNLWVVCDIESESLNKEAYESFGNNGIYVVPTAGPSAGDAFQFASGPVECELTGPWFHEEEGTLFLSVQHPGEETQSLDALTSHWPEGGKVIPRPAAVAITGFPLK
jgi:uncharacterized protein